MAHLSLDMATGTIMDISMNTIMDMILHFL
jgi:hypothetical protein